MAATPIPTTKLKVSKVTRKVKDDFRHVDAQRKRGAKS